MDIRTKSVNTIRLLSVDGVERAKSGHPGLPMGAAPTAYALWADHLNFNPKDSKWPNRDRFILSAGHGSMLLYSLLHLFGFNLSMDELKKFRQWGSKTPGHPEYLHTEGVETTTGPLGQGFANGVGMAIGERRLAAQFNTEDFPIINHYTYVLCGDGDLMEGVSYEAASLAGHLGLGKLICLYDDNNITIDGSTSLAFTEDVKGRFEAMGWEVIVVEDGNNLQEISDAIDKGKQNLNKPTLIKIKTTIGYGSPNKAGKAETHGAPLGNDEVILTKKNLGWPLENDFYISQDVEDHFKDLTQNKINEGLKWNKLFEAYREKYPEKSREWDFWHSSMIDSSIFGKDLNEEPGKSIATRSASGIVINKVKDKITNLVGGSADLNSSTKTYLKGLGDFTKDNPKGNNIFFGVREHAMAAMANGIALYGGLRVFASTFLVFSDYMRPSIRLAALMGLPVTYVFTHDSIAVGEDGPTHQPIEHLASLRAIPNLTVIRPADFNETIAGWHRALTSTSRPTALILTRQDLSPIGGSIDGGLKGAYIIRKEETSLPDIILLASGSEVSLAIKAAEILEREGTKVRVVSFTSWEIFDEQNQEYKDEVLPSMVTARVAVEAGSSMGWLKYIGEKGRMVSIDTFGASAPGDVLMEKKGFTVSNIVFAVKTLQNQN